MFIYFSLKSQNIILYYLCFCLQLRRDCRVKLWNILSVIFHPSLRKSSCKWVKSRRKCYQNHGKHIVKYNDECWVLGGSDLGVYGRTNFIDSVILWPLLCKLEPGLHCLWLNNCVTWVEITNWSLALLDRGLFQSVTVRGHLMRDREIGTKELIYHKFI